MARRTACPRGHVGRSAWPFHAATNTFTVMPERDRSLETDRPQPIIRLLVALGAREAVEDYPKSGEQPTTTVIFVGGTQREHSRPRA